MFYVKQVKMKDGSYKWAIKNRVTHKTARNPYSSGYAYYDTQEEAERNVEAVMMVYEQENP